MKTIFIARSLLIKETALKKQKPIPSLNDSISKQKYIFKAYSLEQPLPQPPRMQLF
ncbi:MAG: hypothetical protein ACXWM7_04415 [Parachlamydiaceae bacterium]